MLRGSAVSAELQQLIYGLRTAGFSHRYIRERCVASGIQIGAPTVRRLGLKPILRLPTDTKRKFMGPRHPALRADTSAGQRVRRHFIRLLKSGRHFTSIKAVCLEAGGPRDLHPSTYRRWAHSLTEKIRYGRRRDCAGSSRRGAPFSLTSGHRQSERGGGQGRRVAHGAQFTA
jgi:hypothetical protein